MKISLQTARRRAVPIGLVGLVVTTLGSCGSDSVVPSTSVEFRSAFSIDTLESWATYGEALIVFGVDAERVIETEPSGPTYIEGRVVDITVEHIVWSQPDNTPFRETRLEVETLGWRVSDGKRYRLQLDAQPWLEVGGTYIGVMGQLSGELSLLQSTILPFRDGTPAGPGYSPATDTIVGQSLEELSEILDGTSPREGTEALLDRDALEIAEIVGSRGTAESNPSDSDDSPQEVIGGEPIQGSPKPEDEG